MASDLMQLDDRRRGTLPKGMGRPGLYLADVTPDGTIILTPAAVIPEADRRRQDEEDARILAARQPR